MKNLIAILGILGGFAIVLALMGNPIPLASLAAAPVVLFVGTIFFFPTILAIFTKSPSTGWVFFANFLLFWIPGVWILCCFMAMQGCMNPDRKRML